jgi:radical SAM family uncharacterized protein/radical SAM-linked protein
MSEPENKLQYALEQVQKPGRYIGGEWNQIKKNPEKANIKVALAFPDVYEVGMSHLGQKILYHLLNQISGVAAERVYAPWVDFEKQLRELDLDLFTLENRVPINRFDIIGFSLLYELNYINILTILNLGKIPFYSRDRLDGGYPLVIAGGPAAFNPEPVADIFDAVVVGDGEEVFPEIVSKFMQAKNQDKRNRLQLLQSIPGVYVPSLYAVYKPKNSFRLAVKPKEDAPPHIKKRMLPSLDKKFFPESIIVPNIGTIFDRVSVEAGRGCPQNCRFCQARHLYFPMRWKNAENIAETLFSSVQSTGYEDASLAALSIGDYPGLNTVIENLMQKLSPDHISLSLSALRPEMLTQEIAENIMRVRKTGLTLVPEAGTERLRKVINKNISEEEIQQAAAYAFSSGWRKIKLYFMVGLPTETHEDIQGIIDTVVNIIRIGYRELKKSPQINLSIASFIPKPHTPFQWDGMNPEENLLEKHKFIKSRLKKYRFVQFKDHSIQSSILEAVFSRGDRKLTPVLLNAWENGARFDSWSDCFNFSLWHTAFAAHGLDIKDYLQSIDKEAALPWDHIDTGINKSYLLKEWDCSRKAEPTPKCRDRNCSKCKGCSYPAYDNRKTATVIDAKTEWPSIGKKDAPHIHRYRVRYAKTGIGRYFSHIETSTILQRSLRRAGVKAIYSRGYHPKMQLSFPPALALGMEGKQELFEFRSHFLLPDNAEESINKYLPEGIQLSAVNDIKYDAPSLTKSIQHLVYSLNLEAEPIRKSLEARAGGNLDSFMKIFVDYDKESGPGALQKIKLNSEENSLIMVYSFHPGISIRPQSILEEEFTINQPSFYLTREDIRLF